MKLVAWISTALACLDSTFAGIRSTPPTANPVILVHGIYSSSGDMTRLARHLEREGHEVFALDLTPCNGQCGLDELAGQLNAFIAQKVPRGKFDLVGFSMGGLVSRYYMQRLGGVERVEHFVTLAAPHQGTVMAGLALKPGVRQMQRRSSFLRDLERDQDSLKKVKFTSFYTPLDLVVVPGDSAELPQARNVRIWSLWHPGLILEQRSLRAVSAALAE